MFRLTRPSLYAPGTCFTRRLGGPQVPPGHFEDERSLLPLTPRNSIHGRGDCCIFSKYCEQIAIFILYEVSLRLVILLEFIYTLIDASDILVLNCCFELINSTFRTLPLYVPEMHTAFCPTLLSSFPLIWLRLFNHCNLAFFLWWKFIRVCGIF